VSVPTQRDPAGPDTAVQVVLARLEGKVDVALAQHGAKLDSHAAEILDHETRLRAVEQKPTVSPATLWTVVLGAGGLLATAAPLVERIYS
jgi:hypothetical protein